MAIPPPQSVEPLTPIQEAVSPIAEGSNTGYTTEQLLTASTSNHLTNGDEIELTPSKYQVSIDFVQYLTSGYR